MDDKWYPEFYDYQKAAMEIAKQFRATFIPFQNVFDEAQKRAPGSYWTGDGVHPTLAGAQLMAKAWMKAIELVKLLETGTVARCLRASIMIFRLSENAYSAGKASNQQHELIK